MANYHPSPSAWERDQVALIDANGTTDGVTIMDRPVVLLTMTGRKSGNILKVPLMRVEHDGICVAVASKGGAPDHPQWYYNLLAHPDITLQDGAHVHAVRARELTGSEPDTYCGSRYRVCRLPGQDGPAHPAVRAGTALTRERRSHQSPRTGRTSGT